MNIPALKIFLLKESNTILAPAACLLSSRLPGLNRKYSNKTLVLRPGGMGDLICADIAIDVLGLTSHNFTWLIEKRSEPWARYRQLSYLCYDKKFIHTFTHIIRRYAQVINTEQYYGLAQAYALLAKRKNGRLVSFSTNRSASWSDLTVSYDWRDAHETVEFGRLFSAALGLGSPSDQPLLRARLFPADRPPLVLLAGLQSRSRRLTPEQWTTIIAGWHRNRTFLIAAAPQDSALADKLTSNFKSLASRFSGTFPELCNQIARSEEILTMDGGSVHIASYFGVPTLALFTSGRDHKWSPLAQGSMILRRSDLSCQPCTKFGYVPPCPHRYACCQLDGLSPTITSVQEKKSGANGARTRNLLRDREAL